MKTSLLKFYIIAFYLCSTFVSFAQIGSQDSTNDLESTDAPAAPINDYLWILALCVQIPVILTTQFQFKVTT